MIYSQLTLTHLTGVLRGSVALPASKSESNRALIIKALSGASSELHNLSEANDTKIITRLLQSTADELNAEDAGTVMRFMTAYLAVTDQHATLTGTPRMQRRPIGILVDALRQLGAQIEYLGQEGFPPLRFKGIDRTQDYPAVLQVRGDISSQYISALLMVAPLFPHGLTLELQGKIGSHPYILMTLSLMQHFGVYGTFEGATIIIPSQNYRANQYTIESDWSGASYWYSMVALAKEATVALKGLRQESFQGDSVIAAMMEYLGVHTTYTADEIMLTKTNKLEPFRFDFTDCPDLAQTIAVVAAAKGLAAEMTGLESLRIKETDRIAALQQELSKVGGGLADKGDGLFQVIPATTISGEPVFATYEDHRMAMAFASKSDTELFKMYRLFATMNNNLLVKTGGNLVQRAFRWGLPVKFLVKPTIFRHFCGGENLLECNRTIEELGEANIGTILDYSVEGENNENSFDRTSKEILATIEKAHGSRHIPFSVFKVTGLADSVLLEKLQAKQPLTPPEEKAFARAYARMDTICRRAHQYGVAILVDAEESWFQETIDHLTYEMMAKYNTERAIVYNTYQLYRRDRLDILKRDCQQAVENNYYLGAKLVRGAYMEKEATRAAAKGYPNPINPTKQASDALFNEALTFCVENIDRIAICAGTHNEASSYLLLDLMARHGIRPNDKRIYFAQLYGMSDNLSYNLAYAGYNVAKYVPYGPVEAVIPYLLRRAEENTAIAGQSSREFNLIKKEIKRRKQK